jgi:hypothetical protein
MLGRFIVGLPTNALNKIFMSLYGVDTEEYYDSIAKVLLKRKQVEIPDKQMKI